MSLQNLLLSDPPLFIHCLFSLPCWNSSATILRCKIPSVSYFFVSSKKYGIFNGNLFCPKKLERDNGLYGELVFRESLQICRICQNFIAMKRTTLESRIDGGSGINGGGGWKISQITTNGESGINGVGGKFPKS